MRCVLRRSDAGTLVAYQDGSTENVNLDKQRIKYKYDGL